MSTPEQIERDIENTRHNLSNDVERLDEKVSPGRVVGRRVDRVKTSATSMKDRVMGSMPSTDGAGSQLSSAKDAMGSAASSIGDAPQVARRQAQGNPLAAGLIAFGIGMLVSSLAPVSEPEKQLAAQAEDKAKEPIQQQAHEVASELAESAKESAQQLKHTASHAAGQTVDQAKSAADDVREPLQR
jgi:uncharacterized protein DUF3618